jgi:hypothetical protein
MANNNLLSKLSFLLKIADSLAGDIHKEKEYRINLKKLPAECDGVKPIIIKQGILREVKDGDKVVTYCRIRSMQEPGKTVKYSLGVKNFSKNEESESEISKETFDSWYPENLDKPQEKKRYKIPGGWTVDDIDNGDIVAEYEYKNKSEIPDVPKHWK